MGMIDAPVSGGVPGAEKGTLAIMAGGTADDIERARPIVMHLAQRFTRMGDSGAGQVTKLCNQIIVGSLFPVIAEAVRLAEAAGVDAKRLPEALKGGFADSLPLQIFGARMAARRLTAGTNDHAEGPSERSRGGGIRIPLQWLGAAGRYRLLVAQGMADDPSTLVGAAHGKR
jgi:3-hydroxyisobutyrate dehydrogenase-like beta-hydroxyacid dehydrogenase